MAYASRACASRVERCADQLCEFRRIRKGGDAVVEVFAASAAYAPVEGEHLCAGLAAERFHYLKVGLSFLLVFIGVKMLAHHWLSAWGFTTMHSLFVILFILTASIVASLAFPKKE